MDTDDDRERFALIVAGDLARDEYARRLAVFGMPVRAFADSEAAIASLEDDPPRISVLEVESGGYRMCRELNDRFGDRAPVILVSHSRIEPFDAVAGFMLGADDYAPESMDPEEFLARVRRLIARPGHPAAPPPDPLAALTPRERQILELLAAGRTQKQVAMVLGISGKTVGTHVQNTLAKLGVHSRVQAVSLAVRSGREPA